VNTAGKQQQVATESGAQAVSPVKFLETMHAYQRTAALKAAIDLELFTAVGETTGSLAEISQRIKAPERGVRALCDFMVISGFLNKDLKESRPRYSLTPDSAVFLHKRSPTYVGCATVFLASPFVTEAFRDLASVVRAGGPPPTDQRIDTENPAWVDFARGMAPVMYPVAEQTEKLVRTRSEMRVLDVAAGHGLFGIAIARQNTRAKIVALDWPSVLTVTKENAERFGVYDRYLLLAGNALEVPFGDGFDVALAANLLHQWDRETIQVFLKKAYGALAPGGRIVVVEFAPNDDRVSPPLPSSFVMNMFANTPGGDAYTVSEHVDMLRNAGFSSSEVHPLLPTPQTAIVGTK
jgi:ubiquinone/menaquinone biosynthesis C-methylase UbiE